MALDTLRRLLIFIVLCLAQAMVLNHIRLFGYAMPMLYVYFTIAMPRGYPRWATLLWAFALGLVIDMFSNTPGLCAASLTLTALLQPYLLELFVSRESPANLKTSVAGLGFAKFLTLAAMLLLVNSMDYYSLQLFTFVDLQGWGLRVVGSTLLTLVIIVAIESVRKTS